MCKKIVYLVSFVLVLAFVSNASATFWTNTTGDGLWKTPGNWDTGVVPTPTDQVYLNSGVGPTIDSGTAATSNKLWGPGNGGVGGDMTMTIDGGSLAVSAGCFWSVGQTAGRHGIAVLEDATVTVGTDLYVGNDGDGTFSMSGNSTVTVGGTLHVSNKLSSTFGHVNLYSGLLDTVDLTGYHEGNDILIDIYEGTLIVRKKSGGPLQEGWIDKGYIIGYGGAGTVILEHDDVTGWDTLTAIPEPATIALLSLGGLALIRRKR
jgi:hypothetical protein